MVPYVTHVTLVVTYVSYMTYVTYVTMVLTDVTFMFLFTTIVPNSHQSRSKNNESKRYSGVQLG